MYSMSGYATTVLSNPAFGQSVPKGRNTSFRDASSQGRIISGTHRPREAFYQGTHRSGTHHPKDALSKGSKKPDETFRDTLLEDK